MTTQESTELLREVCNKLDTIMAIEAQQVIRRETLRGFIARMRGSTAQIILRELEDLVDDPSS